MNDRRRFATLAHIGPFIRFSSDTASTCFFVTTKQWQKKMPNYTFISSPNCACIGIFSSSTTSSVFASTKWCDCVIRMDAMVKDGRPERQNHKIGNEYIVAMREKFICLDFLLSFSVIRCSLIPLLMLLLLVLFGRYVRNSFYRVAHKIEHASFLSTPNRLQILGKSGRHKAPRQVVFIMLKTLV